MTLEDFTPGDTILLNRGGVEFTATVTAVERVPDSKGRRHEYVRFTPLSPHEHLVFWYAFPSEVIAILSHRGA